MVAITIYNTFRLDKDGKTYKLLFFLVILYLLDGKLLNTLTSENV